MCHDFLNDGNVFRKRHDWRGRCLVGFHVQLDIPTPAIHFKKLKNDVDDGGRREVRTEKKKTNVKKEKGKGK